MLDTFLYIEVSVRHIILFAATTAVGGRRGNFMRKKVPDPHWVNAVTGRSFLLCSARFYVLYYYN